LLSRGVLSSSLIDKEPDRGSLLGETRPVGVLRTSSVGVLRQSSSKRSPAGFEPPDVVLVFCEVMVGAEVDTAKGETFVLRFVEEELTNDSETAGASDAAWAVTVAEDERVSSNDAGVGGE
jgi:hypothetical protein